MGTVTTKGAVEPKVAVATFLKSMKAAADKTYPLWSERLVAGIEDCKLEYDAHRALLEVHPLEDYYFAGVVALESAKIRSLFDTDIAGELLSQIAEQADAAAGRTDRIVSGLVFSIMSRIDLEAGVDKMKMPYDQVVKVILQRMGVEQNEKACHLITDALYRHNLGEPLARGVPEWWKAFKSKLNVTPPGDTQQPLGPRKPAFAFN